MPLLISKSCQYALRAILRLTALSGGKNMLVKDLACGLGIPHHVLAKIFQNLARKGILLSSKGPSGGFILAKDPDSIRIIEIIEAVDGKDFLEDCFMGIDACTDSKPCPMHDDWVRIREEIIRMMSMKSLQAFADEIAGGMAFVEPKR